MTAPAAMPGEEEIARLLFERSVYHGYDDETLKREWVRTEGLHRGNARAIISLFAPILAENEAYRQNRHFVMGFNAGFDAACEQGLGAADIRAQGE